MEKVAMIGVTQHIVGITLFASLCCDACRQCRRAVRRRAERQPDHDRGRVLEAVRPSVAKPPPGSDVLFWVGLGANRMYGRQDAGDSLWGVGPSPFGDG